MKTVKIYRIINKINGQCYVGQTTQTLKKRFAGRFKNYRSCRKIRAALEKFGTENFDVELLEECDITLGDERERYYIKLYDSINNGYNLASGGKKNYIANEESKKMLSNAKKGLHSSPTTEFKKGNPSPNKGKHLSEITRKKLSENHKGKHNSPATEFTSERTSGANNARAYPVYQYDLNNNFIAEYETALLASQITGVHRQAICLCRVGRKKTAGGYIWKKEKNNEQ